MNLKFVGPLTYFLIGLTILASSLLLVAWYTSFQAVFLLEDLLLSYNPLGLFTVIAILVIGGIYLMKIGMHVIRDSLKG